MRQILLAGTLIGMDELCNDCIEDQVSDETN